MRDDATQAPDLKWCEPCTSPIWCRAHDCCGEFTDEMPPKPVTVVSAFDALTVYIVEWWWPGFKSRQWLKRKTKFSEKDGML